MKLYEGKPLGLAGYRWEREAVPEFCAKLLGLKLDWIRENVGRINFDQP